MADSWTLPDTLQEKTVLHGHEEFRMAILHTKRHGAGVPQNFGIEKILWCRTKPLDCRSCFLWFRQADLHYLMNLPPGTFPPRPPAEPAPLEPTAGAELVGAGVGAATPAMGTRMLSFPAPLVAATQ